MSRDRRNSRTSRKRALSRIRKMRGSLQGKPSPLDMLLKERHEEQRREEAKLKSKRR